MARPSADTRSHKNIYTVYELQKGWKNKLWTTQNIMKETVPGATGSDDYYMKYTLHFIHKDFCWSA
jgi:hypothetical protein